MTFSLTDIVWVRHDCVIIILRSIVIKMSLMRPMKKLVKSDVAKPINQRLTSSEFISQTLELINFLVKWPQSYLEVEI